MIENREIMMRMFPELFESLNIEAVDSYPSYLVDIFVLKYIENRYVE